MEEKKRNECTICKHYGDETDKSKPLERTKVFDEAGNPVNILLCRKHSVELFKLGQKRFLLSHYKILVDIIASDETKFLDVLEKTIKGNPDKIW
jgi:hypothetical protein